MRITLFTKVCVLLLTAATARAADIGKPYRLKSVDLKQRILWSAECREPAGKGLAFGGQDQQAEDGVAHTRVLENGEWRDIAAQLRAANPLQSFHDRAWALRTEAKNLRAAMRHHYFEGAPPEDDAAFLQREIAPRKAALSKDLAALIEALGAVVQTSRGYEQESAFVAPEHLFSASIDLHGFDEPANVITPETLRLMADAQIALELAAESLDAEPAPRSILCDPEPRTDGIAYDAKTKRYVVFGGDHMDYLTNDTWVFDPAARKWLQLRPLGAPPPRANHRLTANGDGTITLTGGYTYAANTDYVGGQYLDLHDGPFTLDIATQTWTGGTLVAPDSRTYRTGPLHPDFYLQGPRPDAAAFAERLAALPANEWIPIDPPHRPKLNRDWGTAILDPTRDILLRWSGGHSAHGGTDVPHFHLATGRWELPIPVEFPLGQLYSNTSYPDGINYNSRPWITGHTYQSYAFDPPSRLLISTGQRRHFHLYDPAIADWTARADKPDAMRYGDCFYTLTLTPTPLGAVCWDKNGRLHRYDHATTSWHEIPLTGDKLPGSEVDNSTIAYDAKRDRLITIRKPYGKPPFDGKVTTIDLKTRTVTNRTPPGATTAHRFAYIDRCLYIPTADIILLGSYLTETGDHTPTPAYDCATDRWITLDLKYAVKKRTDRTDRAFPHGRSDATVFDPKRNLLWGTDTNSQIYVLRLDPKTAGITALE